MLRVPKSLLAVFADYTPAGIDADAVLEHLLRNPDRLPPSLDLIEIRRRGIDDEWTARHLQAIVVQLASGCLRNQGYCDGISIRSSETSSDTQPKSADTVRAASATNWISRRAVRDDDLVLIDAPICVAQTEQDEQPVCLCDYPDYLRRPHDPIVPLRLSSSLRQKLMNQIGPASEWNPLFRTLGTVQRTDGNEEVEVLAIFSSGPGSSAPGWKTDLFAEAKEYQHRPESQQKVFLRELLANLTLAEVMTVEEKKSEIDSLIREHTDPNNSKKDDVDSLRSAEDDIQGDVYGFWPSLIAILHRWPDRFLLSAHEIDRLLEYFDRAFGETWKANEKLLQPLELFRFTNRSAARMRLDLQSLSIQPSNSVPPGASAPAKLNL